MAERPEPDIFVRILNKVDQIDGIAADVREIKNVQREHGRRFDQIDKRFEQVDKRFEQVDKRFEQVGKRFDRVELRLDQLDTAVVDLHQDVKQHSLDVAELKAR